MRLELRWERPGVDDSHSAAMRETLCPLGRSAAPARKMRESTPIGRYLRATPKDYLLIVSRPEVPRG